MYINKLHLRAFGKFINQKIYLGDKFNIIYGENETGKSTIHNFIESIMYGFQEDSERYNKYKPWNSPLYKGSIQIVGDKEKYLVSRDFLLDRVQLSKKKHEDSYTRDYPIEGVKVPGEKFFNINKVSFNNTVSISQLGNKTENELADELKDKIVNLSNTKDEEISIDRIMQSLRSIKDEAGSKDEVKTLLGQYNLRLSELALARESSLNSRRQVMFLSMEKKKLQSKIHELERQIEEKSKEISNYQLSLEKQKFLKARPIKAEIDKIKFELEELESQIIKTSKEDYTELSRIESSLASMKNERQRLIQEKEEYLFELKIREEGLANNIPQDFDIDKLNMDFDLHKANVEELKSLEEKIESGNEGIKVIDIEGINKFIDDYKKAQVINHKIHINNILGDEKNYNLIEEYGKKHRRTGIFLGLLGTISIIGAGLSCYGAYYYDNINYYYGSIGFLIAIICYLLARKKKNIALSAKQEIESMECEYADYKLSNSDFEEEKLEIAKKNKYEDFNGMAEDFQKKETEKSLYEEKIKLINFDKNKLNEIKDENKMIEGRLRGLLDNFNLSLSNKTILEVNEAYKDKDKVKGEIESLERKIQLIDGDISKLSKEINFEEKRFQMILDANGVDDISTFEKEISKQERYETLVNRREYCESNLENTIGHGDYNDLKKKTMNVSDEVIEINKQDIQMDIYRLREEKTKILKNIQDIHKEIEDIEHNTRDLVEVEEEIDFYEEKINTFENKIKVADIAAEKIAKISDSIKGDFMPLLQKSISDNFAYLTEGRYKSVHIDKDMNIRVMSNEEEDRKIDLESLSGGTLDQLYFSLRIALSNILSGNKNVPLILDDSFVQYDSKRLRNSLELLSRESDRRQVILFTCQEREGELSKQMDLTFKYIKLQ